MFTHLPKLGRAYVVLIVAAGAAVLLHSLYDLVTHPVGHGWFLLAALTLLSGSITVRLPSASATISVSEAFVFTSVLLFGTSAGTVTVALDGLIISLWLQRRLPGAYRVLFNIAAPSISLWLAARLFFLLLGTPLLTQNLSELLLPLTAFTLTYFLLNTWIISIAISFERPQSAFNIWQANFLYLSLNYFVGASAAALLVSYTREVNIAALSIIIPLLIASFLSYKASMGRVEDANKHLGELNALYLSTIETLAMAIDAKDQITHGHIRRVQQYAVALARALGVKDEKQIRAIEAAALLHDMGKLAVPEYILNKPGRLSPAEFEKMKLHATVGADILSAIRFPYPVVPIVRHHHENWDGNGYPDGLRGTDIPIGARILSVVDCYDALTSDRPYRPKLAEGDAIRILTERRGTMYDPLVVDGFIRLHKRLGPLEPDAPARKEAFAAIADAAVSTPVPDTQVARLEDISASSEEMLALYELARSLGGQMGLREALDVVSSHLRRLIPATLYVFYLHDAATEELVAAYSFGDVAGLVSGLRIPLGQRLSGWVAANQQTILNSDPVLDLGDSARHVKPRLRSCLSTPLVNGDELIGVMSFYSASQDAFTEDHRRVAEAVTRHVAKTVRQAIEFEGTKSSLRDQLTGLPTFERVSDMVRSPVSTPVGVLLVDVDHLKNINERFGRETGDQILATVAELTRSALRGGDILSRYGKDDFIALLTQTDARTANAVAERVRDAVQQHFDRNKGPAPVSISVAIACAPLDGRTLADLVRIAESRLRRDLEPGAPESTGAIH